MRILKTIFLLGCFMFISQTVFAQAKLVFQIDLKQEMKDSVFVPPEHSVAVTGNLIPFTNSNSFTLKDKAPVDSVYSVEINFPPSQMGKTLKYNFEIKRKESGDLKESQPRLLPLEKANRRELDPAYFNSFAW